MEWGFILAIVGVIVVLTSTIWFFAAQRNEIARILADKVNPIPDNKGVPFKVQGCSPPSTANATGDTITLKDAVTKVNTSTVAIIGWITGAGMIIGGVIWGLVARSKAKPEGNTAKLLSLLPFVQSSAPAAPAASAAATPSAGATASLSAQEQRALLDLLVKMNTAKA